MVQFTPSNEVASYSDESQFQSGHSVDKCGFYAVWQNHYAGQPGHPPLGTGTDIEYQADAFYVKYDGPDVASNTSGMTLQQLYSLITTADNHYQNLWPDGGASENKDLIREWLAAGYPVIVFIDEFSVEDMDLKANPYAWGPAPGQYTHIITLTGLQPNKIDFLCRDTASIGDSGVRPGPRRYAATPLQIFSATVFVPAWMARPTGTIPPAPVAPPPPPPPAPIDDYADVLEAWHAGGNHAPFDPTHAIPASYIKAFRSGHYYGPALAPESYPEIDGVKWAYQPFGAAFAKWDSKSNTVSWLTPGGLAAG